MSKINQKGFSLVEIMVAVGLLSVVSLGIMKLMETTTKNQKISEARNEELMAINNLASAFSARDKCRTFFENRTIGDTVNYDSTAQALYKGASLEGLNSKVKKLIIKADGARDASNGDQRVFLDVYLERKVNGQIIDKKITVPMVMQTDTSNKITSCMTNEDELKKSIDIAIGDSENKMITAMQGALERMCNSLGGEFDPGNSNCVLTDATKKTIACEGLGGYITSGNNCSQINANQASVRYINTTYLSADSSVRSKYLVATSKVYAEQGDIKIINTTGNATIKGDLKLIGNFKDSDGHSVSSHDIYKTVDDHLNPPTPPTVQCGGSALASDKLCCNATAYDPSVSGCCDIGNDSNETNDASFNLTSHVCTGDGQVVVKTSYLCTNDNGGTWNGTYCEISPGASCPNGLSTLVSKKWGGVSSPCTIAADQWSVTAPTCTNSVTKQNPDSASCQNARNSYNGCKTTPANCSGAYDAMAAACTTTYTTTTTTTTATEVKAIRCKP